MTRERDGRGCQLGLVSPHCSRRRRSTRRREELVFHRLVPPCAQPCPRIARLIWGFAAPFCRGRLGRGEPRRRRRAVRQAGAAIALRRATGSAGIPGPPAGRWRGRPVSCDRDRSRLAVRLDCGGLTTVSPLCTRPYHHCGLVRWAGADIERLTDMGYARIDVLKVSVGTPLPFGSPAPRALSFSALRRVLTGATLEQALSSNGGVVARAADWLMGGGSAAGSPPGPAEVLTDEPAAASGFGETFHGVSVFTRPGEATGEAAAGQSDEEDGLGGLVVGAKVTPSAGITSPTQRDDATLSHLPTCHLFGRAGHALRRHPSGVGRVSKAGGARDRGGGRRRGPRGREQTVDLLLFAFARGATSPDHVPLVRPRGGSCKQTIEIAIALRVAYSCTDLAAVAIASDLA